MPQLTWGPSPPRHPVRAGVKPLLPKSSRASGRDSPLVGWRRQPSAGGAISCIGVLPCAPSRRQDGGRVQGSLQKSLGKTPLSGTNRDTRLHPNHHHLRALNRNSHTQIPPIYWGEKKTDLLLALFISQASDSPRSDRGGRAGTHPRDTLSRLQKCIHYPQAASGRAERSLSD